MNKTKIVIFLSLIMLIIGIVFLIPETQQKTYAAGTTLVEVVKTQNKGSTWNNGAKGVYYTNGHEYRYIGAEVDNYVSFNGELYRIVGVFDSNSHGITGKELVKLIRSRIPFCYAWGVYNTTSENGTTGGYLNDWVGDRGTADTSDDTSPANLNVLLNQFFYNKSKTVTGYSDCLTWTYYYGSKSYKTNDCTPIIGYGIKNNVRDYIEEVTWYLKGYNEREFSREEFYTCERSGDTEITGCSSATNGAYAKSTTAKIGLIYVSDYLYASGYYSSSTTFNGSDFYIGNQNWLYKGDEWTITPDADSTNAVYAVGTSSRISSDTSYYCRGVRPSFYLKSSVYITGGNGSFDNPYTLACDDCSS